MNKARITYRFDQDKGNGKGNSPGRSQDSGRVIPLYQEEYRVVEEGADHGRYEGAVPEDREQPRSRRRPEIRDYQGLNQYMTDFGAWSSPFDAETERLEELIRESSREKASRPERGPRDNVGYNENEQGPSSAPSSPQWERGEDQEWPDNKEQHSHEAGSEYEDRREGPIVSGPRYVRHNRLPWLKISASVAGAAVTGVLLGFLALSLFSGSGSIDDTSQEAAQDVSAQDQDSVPASGNALGEDIINTAAGGAASSGTEVALAYGGQTYSVLQNGTFTALQGADQARTDLLQKGLAAVVEQSDKFYVFAGVAGDKESAAVLGKQLKDENALDIYVKSYEVPSLTKVRWNGNADTLKSYLEQSDRLVHSIVSLSAMKLEGGGAAPLDDATLQSLASAHSAWAQASNTVAQEAGDENHSVVQRMNNAMNSAKASLDEYKKNSSAAMLWQAQSYALQFILAEKELLARIGA